MLLVACSLSLVDVVYCLFVIGCSFCVVGCLVVGGWLLVDG